MNGSDQPLSWQRSQHDSPAAYSLNIAQWNFFYSEEKTAAGLPLVVPGQLQDELSDGVVQTIAKDEFAAAFRG